MKAIFIGRFKNKTELKLALAKAITAEMQVVIWNKMRL